MRKKLSINKKINEPISNGSKLLASSLYNSLNTTNLNTNLKLNSHDMPNNYIIKSSSTTNHTTTSTNFKLNDLNDECFVSDLVRHSKRGIFSNSQI